MPPYPKYYRSRAGQTEVVLMRSPNLRFVITGGPGAGKTTVLRALAEHGYPHAAESARGIIRERLASGLPPRPPLARFGIEILRRDIAYYRETRITDHPVFFDRSIINPCACLLNRRRFRRKK